MRQISKKERIVIEYLELMFGRKQPWHSPVWKYLKSIKRLKLQKCGGTKTKRSEFDAP